MAGAAPNLVKHAGTILRQRSEREPLVARRRLESADKPRQAVDVEQPVGSASVVRLERGTAQARYLIRLQRIGDPDFVQVRISDEGQQTGVLVLPAEPTDAHPS